MNSTTPAPTTPAPQRVQDLFKLTLADGLKTTSGEQTIVYRVVTLRETCVADERKAERMAERAVQADGGWKLLVSESDFKHALNMLHLESFHCDEVTIPQAMIDLDLYDRLSSRDLELIEERIFVITLASEVRYGNMTQADFEAAVAGLVKPGSQPPQPVGQAADVGAPAHLAESGPALLTDYLGDTAQGAPEGDGGATV